MKYLNFQNKSILITGGTGSFGQALVKRLLNLEKPYIPKRIIILSRDELKQFEMAKEFNHPAMRFFLGDVRDRDRLEMAFRKVDIIFHAAAMKQVPASEYNPFECVKTNILGAQNVIEAAIHNNISKVIVLSTDKAVNPINLYGATKLAAEKLFIAANNLSGSGGPSFSCVRYGNVLGSRGSIVPLIRDLLAAGATELPLTHLDMTRFWIILPRAIDFVLFCLQYMRGREVFIPNLASMSIKNLFKVLAPKVPVKIIGIRPGEKLHEVLLTEDEARNTVVFSEIPDQCFIIEPESSDYWLSRGVKVTSGFSLASNTSRIIDIPSMRTLLEQNT